MTGTYTINQEIRKIKLVRTSSDGSKTWEHTFTENSSSYATDVIECSDRGFCISGGYTDNQQKKINVSQNIYGNEIQCLFKHRIKKN